MINQTTVPASLRQITITEIQYPSPQSLQLQTANCTRSPPRRRDTSRYLSERMEKFPTGWNPTVPHFIGAGSLFRPRIRFFPRIDSARTIHVTRNLDIFDGKQSLGGSSTGRIYSNSGVTLDFHIPFSGARRGSRDFRPEAAPGIRFEGEREVGRNCARGIKNNDRPLTRRPINVGKWNASFSLRFNVRGNAPRSPKVDASSFARLSTRQTRLKCLLILEWSLIFGVGGRGHLDGKAFQNWEARILKG